LLLLSSGACALAEALKGWSNIRYSYFDNNAIGDEGRSGEAAEMGREKGAGEVLPF
jgi:hypothetical protein